jgi:two-component system, sporulation sensor kinase B
MAFPIRLEIGFIYDLRYIPFLIIALFGGYKFTFPVYIILNVYRFLVGGEGTFHSFIFASIIFITVPLLHKWFIKQSAKNQIWCAVIVSITTMLLYLSILGILMPELNREFWTLTINALTTSAVVMFIIMILIEQILANIKKRESTQQSERFTIISELSASVAHEIRNPLTVTNGFLQLLYHSQNITQEEKKYIDFSLVELKRAERIVSDFLAFSKPQSENMIFSNLKEETEYVKDIITPFANMHQVDIQFKFTNTLNIKYDKNQMQQCLMNLYKNGIESMIENGGILSINVTEHKDSIMIIIKDTGIGMTKDEVSKLGRPYYSTKKEGTGLGMLMVYSTISKINGKIEVQSEKGKGTTFIISIPA